MSSKRIQGQIPGAPAPQEQEKDDKIDPEKFRKVMKVDESDEAQKRHKRNLRREEEEGEDETQVQEKTPPPPSTSFSEFMNDKDELGNVLDSESGGIRRETAPEEGTARPTPPPGSISTEGVEFEEELAPGPAEILTPPQAPPPSKQPPSEHPPSAEAPLYEGGTEEQPPTVKKPEAKAKKKKVADTSLLASQPKTSELKVKKKGKKRAAPTKKIIPAEPKMVEEGKVKPPAKKEEEEIGIPPEKMKAPEAPPPKEKVKKEGIFHRMSSDEVRKKRMTTVEAREGAPIEGIPVEAGLETGLEEKGGGKKEEEVGFVEATGFTASMPLPVTEMVLTPITPTETTPTYSTLSSEIYELFEKIGGVMVIQQHTGVTTTTMTVNMPNSVFNNAQIIIDQYSTAPHAFNIQLVGTPEAVKAFRANLPQLEQSFKQANYDFEVNLLNPVLTTRKKSPHLIRRKGSLGGKGGRGGKRQKG